MHALQHLLKEKEKTVCRTLTIMHKGRHCNRQIQSGRMQKPKNRQDVIKKGTKGAGDTCKNSNKIPATLWEHKGLVEKLDNTVQRQSGK